MIPPSEGTFQLRQLRLNIEGVVQGRVRRPTCHLRCRCSTGAPPNGRPGRSAPVVASCPDGERYISATGEVRLRYTLDASLASTVREVRLNRLDVTAVGPSDDLPMVLGFAHDNLDTVEHDDRPPIPRPPAEPAVVVEHVVRRFGGRIVLQDISFTVAPSTAFGIAGANGSGKTVLLRLIASLDRPTSGRISIHGYDTMRRARAVREPDRLRPRRAYAVRRPERRAVPAVRRPRARAWASKFARWPWTPCSR